MQKLIKNILLKKAQWKCTVLEMINDKSTILDREVNLYLSTSRHYCIVIVASFTDVISIKEILFLKTHLPYDKKLMQIWKIQYMHQPKVCKH